MEHLPLPQNPAIGTLDIPFLCTGEYDGGPFKDYPARCGWQIELRPVEHIRFYQQGEIVTDQQRLGDLLQRWLYLGLLSEVTGVPAKLALFRREKDNGEVVFSSAELGKLVGAWSIRILENADGSEAGLGQIQALKNHVYSCIEWMGTIIQWVVRTQDDQPNSTLSRICLSIALLGEAITATMKDVFIERGLPPTNRFSYRFPSNVDCGKPIIEIMKRNGWCPNRLAYFDNAAANLVGMLWFYANLKPPEVADGHRSCTSEQCLSLQVDLQEYHTRHVNKKCNCAFLGPDKGDLAEAVSWESIPLAEMLQNTDGDLGIKLSKGNANTEFVAISHVWADGFGNNSANALPSCTVRFIQQMINHLPRSDQESSLPFWMDTLCLPVGPKDLRKRALQRLNEPYKKAKFVLVVDSYLRELDLQGMSSSEIIARVVVSGWHQRLWTFAEGRIAQKVVFLFKNGIVDLLATLQPWVTGFKRIPSQPANDIDMAVFSSYTATKLSDDTSSNMGLMQIQNLRTALSTRTTSHASDETLCLGVIMDLDLKPIVEAEEADKMSVVWSMTPKIPIGLAFSHTSRKLSNPGYRWAPASMMGDTNKQLWSGPTSLFTKVEAESSGDGLLFSLRGIFFKDSTATEPSDETNLAKMRLLEICRPDNPHYGAWDLWLRDPKGHWFVVSVDEAWHHHPVVDIGDDQEPAIILESTFENTFDQERPDVMYGKQMDGLLVTYPRSENGRVSNDNITYAQVHRHIKIQVVSKQESEQFNVLKSCAERIRANKALDKEVAELQSHPLSLTQEPVWLRKVVEEQARRDEEMLLRSGRETQAYRSLNHDDKTLLKLFSTLVTYFVGVGEWIEVEETTKAVRWCVD